VLLAPEKTIALQLLMVLLYVIVPTELAFLPFPDLSFHRVTFDPDSVTVDGSAASSHSAHPEMSIG
jgi:hypothetical protein